MKIRTALIGTLIAFLLGMPAGISAQSNSDRVDVLVIDPGHGGKDPGCVGKTAREKDIVLSVALKFGAKVKERFPDVKVVYTRSDDRFVELWKRGQIANDNHADLFVSIHCNAAGSSSARGMETWLRGSQKDAANLAEVQRENAVVFQEQNHEKNYSQSWLDVVTATVHQDAGFENSIYFSSELQALYSRDIPASPNRGIKQGPFYVLWKSARPSVLTELGFLSNPSEEKFLLSKEGQDKVSDCLLEAFAKYKQRIDSRAGATGNVAEMTVEKESAPHKSESIRTESAAPDDLPSSVSSASAGGKEPALSSSRIVFKVQIAASSRKLDLKPYNFKGLEELSMYYEKSRNLYKYFYSQSASFQEIQTDLEKAKKAGYGSAFIAAFEDGEPVSVQEAVEKQNRK